MPNQLIIRPTSQPTRTPVDSVRGRRKGKKQSTFWFMMPPCLVYRPMNAQSMTHMSSQP